MVADETRRTSSAKVVEVVLVGAGERSRAWLETIGRAARLRLVATVVRHGDPLVDGVPVYRELDEAVSTHPSAAFAIALPPRAGLDAALRLQALGRVGVVEAPLHDALCDADLGGGGGRMRVAHGWATLPARKLVEKLVGRLGGGSMSVEVSGLPESDHGDPMEVLIHALALVRSLSPGAAVVAARQAPGAIFVDLRAGAWTIELKCWSYGQRLAVHLDGEREAADWAWRDGRETLAVGNRTPVPSRFVPDGAARALAQMVTGDGDSLRDAAEVLGLARNVEQQLAEGLAPGGRRLRQSAAIAERRPDDILAVLGLQGDLPSAEEFPRVETPQLPAEPLELWAFRAGLKPVVFLTVEPAEVDRILACFGQVHCERRERRVSVSAQDRWDDRRNQGEERVELYLSHDATLARRAAHLQSEVDPSDAIRELGELVGYPSCCVAAFAEQDDRANNSLNRYYSWRRTMARHRDDTTAWPWQLNNLFTVVAPFYPCTYRCEHALDWSSKALEEMSRQYPAESRALGAVLSRPVLYFDHDHQIALHGRWDSDGAVYDGVSVPAPATGRFAALVRLIATGRRLYLEDALLRVESDSGTSVSLGRTDPALGFVAPFG